MSAPAPAWLHEVVAAGGRAWAGPGVAPWTVADTGDPGTVALRGTAADPRRGAGPPRAAGLAAGAAVLAMRLVVRAHGRRTHVSLLPDATDPWTLAHLRLGGALPASEDERALATAAAGDAPTGPVDAAGDVPRRAWFGLRRAAEAERGWLARVDDPASPGPVLVVGTVHDAPLAHLQAGQAAQRVLLTAALHGLALSAVIGPEAPAAREALRRLLGGGLWPQVLLRRPAAAPDPG